MKSGTRRQTPAPALTAAEPPLSPARAFVVQFRAAPNQAGTRFTGRVEHMSSGHAARFESPEELLAFFAREMNAGPTELLEEGESNTRLPR